MCSAVCLLVLSFSLAAILPLPISCLVRSEWNPDDGFHVIQSGNLGALHDATAKLQSSRFRRSVDSSPVANMTKNSSLSVIDADIISNYNTKDQNDRLLLWIPGNDNPDRLVFAFTRMFDYSANFTSKLLVSHDYGLTYTDVAPQKLKLPNGQIAKIHSCIKTPASTQRYIFTDVEHDMLFLTTDGCRSFTQRKLAFKPNEITIDPRNVDVLIGRTDNDPLGKLWVSTDFGLRWKVPLDHVARIEIGTQYYDVDDAGRSVIYAQRGKQSGKYDVMKSSSYFLNETRRSVVVDDVEEFEMMRDFLFVTKRESAARNAPVQLWLSYQRKPFVRASFDTDKPVLDYFVADTTDAQAVLAVTFSDSQTDLFFSVPGGAVFTRSLNNVLFYHPSPGIGKFALQKRIFKPTKAFAEVYRVHGLHAGVYIASQLVSGDSAKLGNSYTMITYDNGANWIKIRAPRLDHAGNATRCEAGHQCYLHFMQAFPLFASSVRPQHNIFSSISAPGFIIASGVLGESTIEAGGNSVFISTNAGFSWRESLRGIYHFAVGDHGGLIVAVNAQGPTTELLYSSNEGFSWKTLRFSDDRIIIKAVMTEPGEKESVFSLFGFENLTVRDWRIIRVNLTKIFQGTKCQAKDFKEWTFGHAVMNNQCLMGQRVSYFRKAATSHCQVGRDYQRKTSVENCSCQYYDYECDVGFVRSNTSNRIPVCERDVHAPASLDRTKPPAVCVPGTSWLRSRKYRKIPLNQCSGGISRRYEPEKVACAWPANDDFLLYASNDIVKRINLNVANGSVLDLSDLLDVQGDKVTSLDYDYQKRCMFWSEVQARGGRLMRICFNGNSSRSLLAETNIVYPIAVSYDWMNRNLYWIDRGKGTIEAIDVDGTFDGRMRTTIISNMSILSEATDLVVYPPKGIMFWSFVKRNASAIYQANLDGSAVRVVDSTIVPNSLAFDYENEKLLYSDHVNYIIGQISMDLGDSKFGDLGYFRDIVRKNRRYPTKYIASHRNRIFYSAPGLDNLFVLARGVPFVQSLMPIDKNVNVLKGFLPATQLARGACATATQCRTLCVTAPNNLTACLCPDGFVKSGTDCLCPDGTPIGPDRRCSLPSECKIVGLFDCRSDEKLCIPSVWRCDGENDCHNGLDEEDCELEAKCGQNMFQCGDATCIDKAWHCDGEVDCNDQSDEDDCPSSGMHGCKLTDHFRCNDTGKCIPDIWKCDWEDDCLDGSDEQNCPAHPQHTCAASEFRCLGDDSCIEKQWRCDLDPDCADGSDELDCGNVTCPHNYFQCSNKRCVNLTWRCDGMDDCLDDSDELNCTEPPTVPKLNMTYACTHDENVQCGDGTCVPLSWKCDGARDCLDGADEQGCEFSPPDPIFVPCSNNTIQCVSTGRCVNATAKCDGVTDCPGGEDEHHCRCQEEEFNCGGDDEQQCIPSSFVCDGQPDCLNQADEEHCEHRPKCTAKQFQCRFSGTCIPAMKGCDGVRDCPQNEDEFGCLPPDGDSKKCNRDTEFRCATMDQCVPSAKRCDQKKDCLDGSDEEGCEMDLAVDTFDIKSVQVNRTSITANSAFVSWIISADSSGKTITDRTYFIRVVQVPPTGDGSSKEPASVIPDASSPTANVTLRNLQPYTIYRAYVRRSTDKAGRKDKFVTFTTKMDTPTPPLNVRVAQTSLDRPGLRIDWNPAAEPNGRLTWYVMTARYSTNVVTMNTNVLMRPHIIYNDVRAETNYTITVRAVVGTAEEPFMYQSNESTPVQVLVSRAAITEPVRSLKSVVNDTCVTLTWTKPNTEADVVGYYVDHLAADQRLEVSSKDVAVESGGTRCEICGLRPSTTYEFYVRAHNGALSAGPTADIEVTTTGQLLLPPRVLSVTPIANSQTSVTLSWQLSPSLKQASAADIIYGIYYGITLQEAMSSGSNRMAIRNDLTAVIKDLHPCRAYIFLVRMDGPGAYSNFSDAFIWNTLPDLNAAPTNVRVAKTANRQSVMVIWNAACGAMSQRDHQPYLVQLYDFTTPSQSPPRHFTSSFTGSSGNVTLGVRMSTRYGVKVKFAGADAAWSEIVNFTTPTYESPEQFTAYQNDNGTFVLSWSNPKSVHKVATQEGISFRYNITVMRDGEPERFFLAVTSPFLLELRPLSAGTYSFRVAAVDAEDAVGERSPVISVIGTKELSPVADDESTSAGVIVPILVVLTGICLVGVIFVRRRRRIKRSGTSFITTRFHNTPYGNDVHDLDMEEEDLPVFRAFADDEPLVRT